MKQSIYQKYKHAIPLFVYFIIYIVWFAFLEKHVTTNFHIVHMEIDDKIPFIPSFVIPYFLWFGYVSVTVIYFFFKDKQDYNKLCVFLFTGMTIFLIVSTIYPNGQLLRPTRFAETNLFTKLIASLYKTDTATNLFPSIHVYNSLGTHFAIARSERLSNKKWIRFGSFLLSTSIILSTMFIKQHSMFDVLTACGMAAVMYLLVYRKRPELEMFTQPAIR